jgi:hypothetical protein
MRVTTKGKFAMRDALASTRDACAPGLHTQAIRRVVAGIVRARIRG